MDRITEGQLAIFCREYGLEGKPQDVRFEHYAAFATIKRHYDRTFNPADVVIGRGGDTGIDAVAIIVNNVLVTDLDQINELAEQNGYVSGKTTGSNHTMRQPMGYTGSNGYSVTIRFSWPSINRRVTTCC